MLENINQDVVREILNSIFKIGEVSSVDYEKGTARVVFDDDDSIVSNDLQVVHKNTMNNKDFAMPDIGEDVLCIFLPSGVEEGFIIGSVYAGEITPPESSGDKRTVLFSDGTKVSYDRATHQMDISISETTIIANRQDVKINTPNNVEITTAQNVVVDASGAVNIIGASSATVKAPTITLDGNVSVTGNISIEGNTTSTGDVIGANISLQGHMHTGNLGAPTSPPIP